MIRTSSRSAELDPRLNLDDEDLSVATANAYPSVARQLAGREGAGLMMGISIALLLGAATLFGMTVSRAKEPLVNQASQSGTNTPQPQPGSAMPNALPNPPQAPPVAPNGQVAAVPPAMALPAATFTGGSDGVRSPALVFDALTTASTPSGQSTPSGGGQVGDGTRLPAVNSQGLTADEQFVQRIASEAGSAKAGRMEAPRATVAQGTLIAAVLETSLNSDLPGYVRAVISRDVKSFDGSNLLIPRGSRVIGEYKSGLAVGQTRAFILWTRLIRPDGVSIALASPATDASGSNGVSGKVDTHFGKRFGAAILLSMISAGGQAVGGGGGTLVIAGPAQAASSVAQRDINIPPTVRVAAGQPIRIFVARDLDFSPVSAGK